jgi:hypothetical protein
MPVDTVMLVDVGEIAAANVAVALFVNLTGMEGS